MITCYRIAVTDTLDATLTTEQSTVDDSGTYTVYAMNDAGEATSSAAVSVLYEHPRFTRPLRDFEIKLKDSTAITCSYVGIPKPVPTWLISGVKVVDSDRYRLDIEENTATLTVHEVAGDDYDKVYACVISNAIGQEQTTCRLIQKSELSRIR